MEDRLALPRVECGYVRREAVLADPRGAPEIDFQAHRALPKRQQAQCVSDPGGLARCGLLLGYPVETTVAWIYQDAEAAGGGVDELWVEAEATGPPTPSRQRKPSS
jgi:hypothetical protein